MTDIKEITFQNTIIRYRETFYNEDIKKEVERHRKTLWKSRFSMLILLILIYIIANTLHISRVYDYYVETQTLHIRSLMLIIITSLAGIITLASEILLLQRIKRSTSYKNAHPCHRLLEIAENCEDMVVTPAYVGEVFMVRNGKKEFLPLPVLITDCIDSAVTEDALSIKQKHKNPDEILAILDFTREYNYYITFLDGPKITINKEEYLFPSSKEFPALKYAKELVKEIL